MQIVKWAPVIEKAYIPHMGAELVQHLKGRKGTVLYESCSAWQLLYNTLLERGLPVQEVSFNDNGKPYFTKSKIFFSLSHSHGLCAIAISDITVGVDIEVIKDHYNTHMVERSLCNKEREVFKGDFTRIWCRKEAIAKKKGTGITGYPSDIDTTKESFREKSIFFREKFYWLVCTAD